MKSLLVLVALLGLSLFVFSSCGLEELGMMSEDSGVAPQGDSGVDSASCWGDQKLCENVCTSTALVEKGCAGSGCEPCNLPHATAKCASENGLCAVASCEPGWENCDKDTSVADATGCEAQIAVDPKACGPGCTDCQKANGPNWTCCNGQCVRDDCIASGMLDCDCAGECDVAVNDVNNCGFCNHKCEFPHATASCQPDVAGTNGYICKFKCWERPGNVANYGDCNGLEADGCEVNLDTDPGHCGSCAATAVCDGTHGTPGCAWGKCVINCDAGWGNCDKNPANGCETPLNTLGNCGSCGSACAPAHANGASCGSGACDFSSCQPGWENCNSSKWDGCETPTNTTTNCGGCGQPCAPQHATGVSCASGKCDFSGCATGWDNCNSNKGDGCETSTTTLSNCGTCGSPCAPAHANSPSCSTGSCGYGSCMSGWKSCNGSSGDGCETPITTLADCGDCGLACNPAHAGGATCNTGSCSYGTCDTGWADCNTTKTDGCETALGTLQNCSACKDGCINGRVCQGTAGAAACACPGTKPKACPTTCAVDCCGLSDCAPGETCSSGACTSCGPGKVDCGAGCTAGECCPPSTGCAAGQTCCADKTCKGTCSGDAGSD